MTKNKKNDYKLQCKYCSIIMDEDRHSVCEHSNSAYSLIKVSSVDAKHE